MIKIFCGQEATPKRIALLKRKQREGTIQFEEDLKKSHFVFCPSKIEKEQAICEGIPFYTPKDQFLKKIRLYLKQILREFLDDILTLRLSPPPSSTKTLVLRVDAIGDYLLFRNFLKPLYQKYGKLVLVVNQGCKEIVEKCDKEYLDEIIYFDGKKFSHNLIYRTKLLRKLRCCSFQSLIHSTYGRDYRGEDIARKIIAKEKIAPIGDSSNVLSFHKKRFDKNYTHLLSCAKEIMFEFDRNYEFVSQICNIEEMRLSIQLPREDISRFKLETKYIIFFIGASTECRKWNIENLIHLGEILQKDYQIVLCGGKEDWQRGEGIRQKLANCINLCGMTTLVELGLVLEASEFVISNETSCVHLYMSLEKKKKIYVLSAGNTIVRFIPYPQQYESNYKVIFHPFIEKNFREFLWISQNITHSGGGLSIKQIDFQDVLKRMSEVKV